MSSAAHWHKLRSGISHFWGNCRGQHIHRAADKPRPGKLPFWWCHLLWQASVCSDSFFICGCLFFLARQYVFSKLGVLIEPFCKGRRVPDAHTVLMLFFLHGAFLPLTFIAISVCICIFYLIIGQKAVILILTTAAQNFYLNQKPVKYKVISSYEKLSFRVAFVFEYCE